MGNMRGRVSGSSNKARKKCLKYIKRTEGVKMSYIILRGSATVRRSVYDDTIKIR